MSLKRGNNRSPHLLVNPQPGLSHQFKSNTAMGIAPSICHRSPCLMTLPLSGGLMSSVGRESLNFTIQPGKVGLKCHFVRSLIWYVFSKVHVYAKFSFFLNGKNKWTDRRLVYSSCDMQQRNESMSSVFKSSYNRRVKCCIWCPKNSLITHCCWCYTFR